MRASLLAILLLLPSCAAAPPTEEEHWEFTVAPYLWAAGLDGRVKLDGQELDLGGDGGGNSDPWFEPETSYSGFMARLRAKQGPWTFAFDPLFFGMDVDDGSAQFVDADISLHAQIYEGIVAREFARGWSWLAGLRYYNVSTDVEITAPASPIAHLGDETDWLDPFVGLNYRAPFCEAWSVQARADIGGFGLGSDLAWSTELMLGYQFTRLFGAELGYRVLRVDFAEGSRSDRVAYDLTVAGPLLLLSFTF